MTFDQGSVEALAVRTEAILAPRATKRFSKHLEYIIFPSVLCS